MVNVRFFRFLEKNDEIIENFEKIDRLNLIITSCIRLIVILALLSNFKKLFGIQPSSSVYLFLLLIIIELCNRMFISKNYMDKLFLLLEYFYVLLLGYFFNSIYFEIIFIPLILTDISHLFTIIPTLLMDIFGVVGAIFLSFGYERIVLIRIYSETYYTLNLNHIFYIIFAFSSIVFALFKHSQRHLIKRYKAEIQTIKQLEIINTDLSRKIFKIQQDSIEEERLYITKEIHDLVGYIFMNLIMLLQASSALFTKNKELAKEKLDDSLDYARRGMNEIRYNLRKIRENFKNPVSLQNNFYQIAKTFSKATDLKVVIDYGDWPKSFNDEVDTFLTSLVRESLTNSLKHGKATQIKINCWRDEKHISISIHDNGLGLPDGHINYGIGISSIRNYVSSIGGNIQIISEAGFMLIVSIPINQIFMVC